MMTFKALFVMEVLTAFVVIGVEALMLCLMRYLLGEIPTRSELQLQLHPLVNINNKVLDENDGLLSFRCFIKLDFQVFKCQNMVVQVFLARPGTGKSSFLYQF